MSNGTMESWTEALTLLVDPSRPDDVKWKAVQGIAENLETIVQSPQYPTFLENAFCAFRRVLSEGQPLYITEQQQQQQQQNDHPLKRLVLGIIQELPINDHLTCHFRVLISLIFLLIEIQNEKSSTTSLHWIKQFHRYLPHLSEDLKSSVDIGFREVLHRYIIKNQEDNNQEWYDCLLELSITSVREGICTANCPINLLTDLFDCKRLNQCESLFEILEKRVSVWKEDIFFDQVKNQMLRCCNDLLRRMSRSQNTVFGGRILEFLATFFPLFERSGLNLTSEFNQENTITFSQDDDSDSMFEDVSVQDSELNANEAVQVDYNLYRKFWQLQTYFRNPNLCYSKPNWRQFQLYSNDILSVFSAFKLDSSNFAHLKTLEPNEEKQKDRDEIHFTRYLTNQKLLELQLSDSCFRRYILIQFLILFQYLTSYVRVKHESQTLAEDQIEWIKKTTEKVLQSIEETPPDGKRVRETIEHILQREEFWSTWKNDLCPTLKGINKTTEGQNKASLRKMVGDELQTASKSGKIVIGNSELTRLWNVCPNNWDACLSQDRVFIPSLEKFFENVITNYETYSADERQKMIVEDSDFSWRALRLLSQKSSHFFTPSNQSQVKPISHYLDAAIEKVIKEFTIAVENNRGPQELTIQDAEDISNDELLKQVDENSYQGPSDQGSTEGTKSES